jgi:hypothetical protein
MIPGAGGHHQTDDLTEAWHSACHLEIDLEKLTRRNALPELLEALELARQIIDTLRNQTQRRN